MMEKHSNFLVNIVLVNYTNASQLIDVILQSHWNTHSKWQSTFGSQESSKNVLWVGKIQL
jgi:hypothetical protein